MAANSPTRLFWIDLEMTGLDINKEVIIECAALVTDFDFKVLDQYETVVKQPQIFLEKMDDWNRTHHTDSGLIKKVPFGREPQDVETDLISLCNKHFKADGRAILAGNSIMQDRLFIDKYWPNFSKVLHYRMVDVSSWKVIFNTKFGLKYEKKNAHRALEDIKESIAELQFYMSKIKR